jgi:hypothetical protein
MVASSAPAIRMLQHACPSRADGDTFATQGAPESLEYRLFFKQKGAQFERSAHSHAAAGLLPPPCAAPVM